MGNSQDHEHTAEPGHPDQETCLNFLLNIQFDGSQTNHLPNMYLANINILTKLISAKLTLSKQSHPE